MAKDEKVVERIEADAPFEVQPFDEKEYIRKELISFRTTLVLFIFSILVAGITFFVWKYAELRFLFLVLIALGLGVALIRLLFKAVRIDVSHWKRREWVGTFFLYFFFWLGFSLLFVNPPFTDAAEPRIEAAVAPAAQAPGEPVALGAYIADNEGLMGEPSFCVRRYESAAPPNLTASERTSCADDWQRLEGQPFWSHNASFTESGNYAVYVIARDSTGHEVSHVQTFEISNPITVSLPRDSRFAVPDDVLTVKVHPRIEARAVQFSLDDGETWHDFIVHPDADKRDENYWRTDPAYEGWNIGTHNVSLRVLLQPQYLRASDHVLRATAVDANGPYRLTIDDSLPEVGTREIDYGRGADQYPEFQYVDPAQTPGIGAPALLASLAGLALAGRRFAA